MLQHSNHRRVPEEEDKKKGHEKLLEEIIAENFPKMGKEIATQVQETQRVQNRINPRQNTSRHILIKLTKIKHKEQILRGWDVLREQHLNKYTIKYETDHQPGWMPETSAQGQCTGKTLRDGMRREAVGGIGMGNTCKSMADSWHCM